MIVIDYLQLMTGNNGNGKNFNREQEIGGISRSLKELSKELDIPVIALAQLSRNVEQRGGEKRPQLSDLRESGSIEQDADMVMFLYRPEYYGVTQDEMGASVEGICELIVAKHRSGGLDTIPLRFIKEFTKFVDDDYQPALGGFSSFSDALASAIFHSLEYMSLVTWSMGKRQKTNVGPSAFTRLSQMWLFFLIVFVVVIGVGNYLLSRGYFELWVFINIVVAFWHYGFDGMIWKSRKASAAPLTSAITT